MGGGWRELGGKLPCMYRWNPASSCRNSHPPLFSRGYAFALQFSSNMWVLSESNSHEQHAVLPYQHMIELSVIHRYTWLEHVHTYPIYILVQCNSIILLYSKPSRQPILEYIPTAYDNYCDGEWWTYRLQPRMLFQSVCETIAMTLPGVMWLGMGKSTIASICCHGAFPHECTSLMHPIHVYGNPQLLCMCRRSGILHWLLLGTKNSHFCFVLIFV